MPSQYRSCYFCGITDEGGYPERFWNRAEFLDYRDTDGRQREAWVCSMGRGAYGVNERTDVLPDMNTCRGFMLDEWAERRDRSISDALYADTHVKAKQHEQETTT
jgi:hypothetical protein